MSGLNNSLIAKSGRVRVRGWFDVMASETGHECNPVKYLERQSARALIDRQTEEIAKKLALAGIDLYAPPTSEPVFLLGELTGSVEQSCSTKYRHCLFLPSVAKRERAGQLRRLEAYLSNHPRGTYARYLVVTNGVRIPWFHPDFRQIVRSFQSRIGTFARIALERFGIEVVVRSTEMTLNKNVSGSGVHLHANIVYIPPYLKDDGFSRFIKFAQNYFKAHVRDNKRIQKLEEIVKYITKPSVSAAERQRGGVGMSELTPDELAWLHNGVSGLHIFQPYQLFRAYCAEIREKRQKLYKLGDGSLVRVQCPDKEERGPASGSRENIIVGRTLPSARFSHIREPVSIVLNFNPNPVTADGKRRLSELKQRFEQVSAWAAANAAAVSGYSVHTSTIIQTNSVNGAGQNGPPVPIKGRVPAMAGP